jgi:hypothetical protein
MYKKVIFKGFTYFIILCNILYILYKYTLYQGNYSLKKGEKYKNDEYII